MTAKFLCAVNFPLKGLKVYRPLERDKYLVYLKILHPLNCSFLYTSYDMDAVDTLLSTAFFDIIHFYKIEFSFFLVTFLI